MPFTPQEVIYEFDRDIAAAHESLDRGFEVSPEIITHERVNELRRYLHALTLPNIHDDTLEVAAITRLEERIPYIPYEAAKSLRTVSTKNIIGRCVEFPFDCPLDTGLSYVADSTFITVKDDGEVFSIFSPTFVANLSESEETDEPATGLLHELIHVAQVLDREPSSNSLEPSRNALLALHSLNDWNVYSSRMESEAYTVQLALLRGTPEGDSIVTAIDAFLNESNPYKELIHDLRPIELVNALRLTGDLVPDDTPDPEIIQLLGATGVIGLLGQ